MLAQRMITVQIARNQSLRAAQLPLPTLILFQNTFDPMLQIIGPRDRRLWLRTWLKRTAAARLLALVFMSSVFSNLSQMST